LGKRFPWWALLGWLKVKEKNSQIPIIGNWRFLGLEGVVRKFGTRKFLIKKLGGKEGKVSINSVIPKAQLNGIKGGELGMGILGKAFKRG